MTNSIPAHCRLATTVDFVANTHKPTRGIHHLKPLLLASLELRLEGSRISTQSGRLRKKKGEGGGEDAPEDIIRPSFNAALQPPLHPPPQPIPLDRSQVSG